MLIFMGLYNAQLSKEDCDNRSTFLVHCYISMCIWIITTELGLLIKLKCTYEEAWHLEWYGVEVLLGHGEIVLNKWYEQYLLYSCIKIQIIKI